MNFNSRIGRTYHLSQESGLKELFYNRAKKEPVNVMASIIRNQTSLYKKELSSWRMAREEAMTLYNPRRVLLTELYRDIELDAFIRGIVHNGRILRVSNHAFKVTDYNSGKEDKAKTDLLQRAWFQNFIKMSLSSKFYGHSLIQLADFKAEKGEFTNVELIYREHVVPEKEAFTITQYGNDYISYKEAPYNQILIPVGEKEDLGLYDPAAPLYILKKHSWSNWDEFEEIFGIPIRIAKTAATDKQVLNEIQRWLKAMGSASYGLFPADTEMEIHESKQTDAFEVFNRKRQAANEELEILLLGLRNLTIEGGTYGKQEAIRKDQQEVVNDDKMFIQHLVNNTLMPMLRLHGYPFTENDMFTWDNQEQLNSKDRLAIFEGVQRLGYTLDQEEVATELGVNITGTKEPEKEKESKEPESPLSKYLKTHNELTKKYFDVH